MCNPVISVLINTAVVSHDFDLLQSISNNVQ